MNREIKLPKVDETMQYDIEEKNFYLNSPSYTPQEEYITGYYLTIEQAEKVLDALYSRHQIYDDLYDEAIAIFEGETK